MKMRGLENLCLSHEPDSCLIFKNFFDEIGGDFNDCKLQLLCQHLGGMHNSVNPIFQVLCGMLQIMSE